MSSYKSKTDRVPVLSEKILTEHIIPNQREAYCPALLFGTHSSGEPFRHSIAVHERSELSLFSDDAIFKVNLTPECFKKFRVETGPILLKTPEGTYSISSVWDPSHSLVLIAKLIDNEGLSETELILSTIEQISLEQFKDDDFKLSGKNLTSGNSTTKNFCMTSIPLSDQFSFDQVFITAKSKRDIEKNNNFNTSTSDSIEHQFGNFITSYVDFMEHPKQMVLFANKVSAAA